MTSIPHRSSCYWSEVLGLPLSLAIKPKRFCRVTKGPRIYTEKNTYIDTNAATRAEILEQRKPSPKPAKPLHLSQPTTQPKIPNSSHNSPPPLLRPHRPSNPLITPSNATSATAFAGNALKKQGTKPRQKPRAPSRRQTARAASRQPRKQRSPSPRVPPSGSVMTRCLTTSEG